MLPRFRSVLAAGAPRVLRRVLPHVLPHVLPRVLPRAALLAICLAALTPGGTSAAHADEGTSRLVLVLDSSGSMKEPDASGSTKIEAAKRALGTVVDKLPPRAPVGMRVYGATVFDKSDRGACTDSQLVVPVGPADKPALKAAIGRYKPYGETPIAYSLRQAAKDVGRTGSRTILLVSDGEETCAADPCAVAREIHQQGIDLRVDVVGMSVEARAERQLRCIADAGGGDFYNARDADDLTAELEQTALRSFRPFTVSGTPVQGGVQESRATDVGAGQYTDELGGTQEETGVRYYRIRPAAGASVHVGFTAYPESHGGSVGYNDAARLALRTPDGTECVAATGLQLQAGTRQILVGSISYVPGLVDDGAACAAAKELVLEVRRGTGAAPDPAPATGAVPFEFLVVDEPALADDTGLPDPVVDDARPTRDLPIEAGQPRGEIAGGGGFAQAATLEPGTWTDTVQGGEVLFYRVRADWGQTPRVSVRIQPSRQAEKVLGNGGTHAQLSVFGPTRAQVDMGDVTSVVPTTTTTLNAALLPVRYRNRELTGSLSSLSDSAPRRSAALAGYYYVVVTLQASDSGRFQLPMELSVAVDGEPSGHPRYTSPPVPVSRTTEPAAPESGDSDGAGRSDGTAAEPTTGRAPGWLLPAAAGGALCVLLLAGIGIGVLVSRRSRRPAAPYPPQSPPSPPRPW